MLGKVLCQFQSFMLVPFPPLAIILRLKVKNKEITTLRQFLDEQASLNQGLRDMLTPQNSGGEAVETRGDEPATVAEGNYIPDKAERKKRHV